MATKKLANRFIINRILMHMDVPKATAYTKQMRSFEFEKVKHLIDHLHIIEVLDDKGVQQFWRLWYEMTEKYGFQH